MSSEILFFQVSSVQALLASPPRTYDPEDVSFVSISWRLPLSYFPVRERKRTSYLRVNWLEISRQIGSSACSA